MIHGSLSWEGEGEVSGKRPANVLDPFSVVVSRSFSFAPSPRRQTPENARACHFIYDWSLAAAAVAAEIETETLRFFFLLFLLLFILCFLMFKNCNIFPSFLHWSPFNVWSSSSFSSLYFLVLFPLGGGYRRRKHPLPPPPQQKQQQPRKQLMIPTPKTMTTTTITTRTSIREENYVFYHTW